MRTKALVAVGALAVVGMALLLALPSGIPGLLDLTGDRLAPPPELRLLTPADGEGVTSTLTLAGQAASTAQAIVDVQYRIDGGAWESVALSARGQRSTPFQAEIPVPPGDHVVEARAYDGETVSIPARVEVRRDAPTVRIHAPADGAGVLAGPTVVSGVVRGSADEVLLEVDGQPRVVRLVDGTWTTTVDLVRGEHTLRATAVGTLHRSLPHVVRVAAGTPPPPSVTILAPRDGAAYGAAGDIACGGGCIVLLGTAERATSVRVDLDGALAGEAGVTAGAWSYRIPMLTLANGTHHVSVRAADDAGATSIERNVTFLARTPISLSIRGPFVAQPTGSELVFDAVGGEADASSWTLDGLPLGDGSSVTFALDRPGDHVLSARTATARGGSASASVVLHAVNRAPEVFFQGDPLFHEGDILLALEASDPDGRIVGYAWDFGDGGRGYTTAPEARHRYAERGLFTASVSAIDDLGAATSASIPVVVANAPPVPSFTWSPERPTVLDVVTLNDTSLDHDGVLVERTWTLPDGNRTTVEAPTFRFRERGPHAVTLQVLDDEGIASQLTRIVEVANLPPTPAMRFEPALPAAHEEILFADASTDLDGPIATRTWDFGDNTSSTAEAVLHTYRKPGTYLVTLTIADDLGAVANLTRNVTVLDSAPAIRGVTLEPAEPAAQEEVRLFVDADDRDGAIIAAHWEFGDGTASNATEAAHRYARSGTYLGNVTVFDEAGLNVTFPFSVNVRNALPRATLDTAPGGRIAAFPTILLANATDPDGRVTYHRFDADGDGIMDCETTAPACSFVYETSGSYLATLIVEDDEGGASQTELLLDVTLPPADHPPPTVRVESPARHSILRGEHLYRGTASGPRDIVKIDMQLRNGSWAYSGNRDAWRSATGTNDWHALIDTRGFADGAYDLVVRATDSAGGQGHARIPITIQNGERPSDVTLQLVEPPALIEDDITIRASAFHPEGVTSVRYRIDTTDWVQETENPLAFTIPIDRDALKPGEHVLRVEAYHGVHQMTARTHAFTIPGTPPTLIIDQAPNAIAHALVHAEGRIHGEGRAQWRIDQGLWHDLPPGASWNLTEDTLDIKNGRHTLSLRAISPDGRLTSDVHTYKVDVVNPPFTHSTTSAPRAERADRDVPLPSPAALLAIAGAAALLARRRFE